MKKIISMAICVMMLVSLFAVNAHAGITAGSSQHYVVNSNFEGEISEGYSFEKTEEVTDENGESYLINKWLRAYAQPIDFPDEGAYAIEFDSKFCDLDGNAKRIMTYIVDKNATAGLDIAGSIDFTLYGDVDAEAKGIDISKWYTFRITIDKAAGISKNAYFCRLYGNGIKLEWKERGADTWKTAVNGYGLSDNDNVDEEGNSDLLTNYGGETLKYTISYISNSWQWTSSEDYNSDGFGYYASSYLDNFKIRKPASAMFTNAKIAEDEDGFYIYSNEYYRTYIQPVNFPENGQYTIEFDSKFKSSVANDDGTYSTQPIVFYVLDPSLTADIENVTSSIDFFIEGSTDMESKGIASDKWYSFKITIDKSKGLVDNRYYGRLQGDGVLLQWKEKGADEWNTAVNAVTSLDYTGADLKYYAQAERTAWQWVNGSDMTTPGIGFNTRTYMDNLKVGYKEAIPSTGVLYYDDFEGATAMGSGIASVEYKNGNNYLALKGDGSSWTGSGQAVALEIPSKFILTMDVCMGADNAQNLKLEYWQSDVATSGVWGQIGLAPSEVVPGKWYTLKIAKVGEDRTYTVTLTDLESGEVKTITPQNSAVGITGNNPGKFMFRGWLGDGTIDWKIDNIIMTEAAAASLCVVEKAADGTVDVTVSADAISDTITPVLALYNENRLVAVDWDTKDNTAFGVSADLAVAGSYDEVKLFVWDGFENATPLMATPWDITEHLAD